VGYRWYCRVATVVFLLFTAFPLVTKIVQHRLAGDWAHSALHLGSAVIACYAGWFARSELPAALLTWAIAVIYGVLGVVGWFIDGLLLGTPVAIPLGPADNVFHLALAAGALVVAVLARGAPRKLAMGAAQRPD